MAKTVEAIEERIMVEIACVRDELLSNIDAKVFGTALTNDYDPKIAERAVADLRKTVENHAAVVGARFGALDDRTSALEGRGSDPLLTSLQARLGGFSAITMRRIDELGKQVEQAAAELRTLRAVLADADILAPDDTPSAAVLALPPQA